MAAHGTRKGPYVDDLPVDVCDLGHSAGGAGANNDPGAIANPGGVFRLVDEPPRKARVVLGVEIELKVELPAEASLAGFAAADRSRWKDTVLVRSNPIVDILLDVTNPGLWMAHCHIAEHSQSGTMFSTAATPATGSRTTGSTVASTWPTPDGGRRSAPPSTG